MHRLFSTLALVFLLSLLTLPTHAGVSIDRNSPSIGACVSAPSPSAVLQDLSFVGVGCDVDPLAGPGVEVAVGSLGLLPMDDIDGLSHSDNHPSMTFRLVFSVDRPTVGFAWPMIDEGAGNFFQAAGDLWRTPNRTAASPFSVLGFGTGVCNPPTVIPPGPTLHIWERHQVDFALVPTQPPLTPNPFWPDNLDATSRFNLDPNGDTIHDQAVYFTLDALSPSATSGAELFTAPTGAPAVAFANPANLGLIAADEVDALVVWDQLMPGVLDPGQDYALFSLAPGSPSLGPHSAADIFVTDFNGNFCLYVLHQDLGLTFNDNVDALGILP